MKTPKSFSDNLKKKIITEDMLGACIYSVNKRAKNFRDNINALYSDLDHVRALYGPTGIQYQLQNIEAAKKSKDEYYKYKEQLLSLVHPISIHVENSGDTSDNVRYYLFYRIGDYSFHKPVKVSALKTYPDLPMQDIETLTTSGHEISDLVSVQFVKKVLHLIKTRQYTYQLSS